MTGRGAERGDYLTATGGDTRFTVLVEIKKPDTELLCRQEYRNGVYSPSDELAGAVSQLQVNCRKWEGEGAKTEQNLEALRQEKIFTVTPKGILVIGCTDELTDHDRRNSFELFRRNLVNPEVLAFDELRERARYIVEHGSVVTDVHATNYSEQELTGPAFDADDILF